MLETNVCEEKVDIDKSTELAVQVFEELVSSRDYATARIIFLYHPLPSTQKAIKRSKYFGRLKMATI